MELRQLRALVALAEERSFTRAAARLHVAQPALSQQVRRLEEEVGLRLVERTTRRVALTDAGALLVGRARRVLAEVDAAQAELADLAGVRAGRVVIGAMPSTGPFDLSRLLAEFHRRYPAVELSIREELTDALIALVRDDLVDLAFVSLAELPDDATLETRTLLTEPLVVLVGPAHPLAGRASVALGDLRDERFVTYREGAGLRRIVQHAARDAGFEPQVAFETNELVRARALVAHGLAVTIVPSSGAPGPGEEGPRAVALDGPALRRDITLASRRGRRLSPAARAFLELARAADRTGAPPRATS